jgi:hypothetical protein
MGLLISERVRHGGVRFVIKDSLKKLISEVEISMAGPDLILILLIMRNMLLSQLMIESVMTYCYTMLLILLDPDCQRIG